jgi:hypothetical protein
MQLFNKPLFDLLSQEMQNRPADYKAWNTIRERGLQAAEIANLIAIRQPPAEHAEKWDALSRAVQLAGMELADAAAARQLQATSEAYERLKRSCNQCHETVSPQSAPRL